MGPSLRTSKVTPSGSDSISAICLAVVLMLLFTLMPGLHQILHHHVSETPVASGCGHKGCSSEEAPLESPDPIGDPNCETCEALSSAHVGLVSAPEMITSPIPLSIQGFIELRAFSSWVEMGRSGRSPPTA